MDPISVVTLGPARASELFLSPADSTRAASELCGPLAEAMAGALQKNKYDRGEKKKTSTIKLEAKRR